MASQLPLLGSWHNNELVSSSFYGNTYNEVWGLAIGGREYAVIGSTAGTHIIDVTEPGRAYEVDFVAGRAQGGGLIHRDYHNMGCYLYAVSDEGAGSLQIMDVSFLPDSVSVVYDAANFFTRSHNIFIDTSRAILYACFPRGSGIQPAPLKLFDISDPTQPREIAAYNNFGSGVVSHVHDCYVKDGLAFLNLGYDGMAIADFSDPKQMQPLGTLTEYPFAGYNHSGWPTDDLQYYYLGDETHGFPVKAFSVSDPSEIEWVANLELPSTDSLSIPHNQIVACNYLYVSYYYDGLQIYDIRQPERPQRVAYYPTSVLPHRKTYEGAWGVYPFLPSGNILVSDMQEGLFILGGVDTACSASSTSELACGPLSPALEAISPDAVRLYPQPAHDQLHLEFPLAKSQGKVNLTLWDVHGRPLKRWERQGGEHSLTLSLPAHTPSGWYLLTIRTSSWQLSRPLLIR